MAEASVIVKLSEVEPVKSVLSELAWLLDNSDGVVGLKLDGEMMRWEDVVRRYMPTLASRLAWSDADA